MLTGDVLSSQLADSPGRHSVSTEDKPWNCEENHPSNMLIIFTIIVLRDSMGNYSNQTMIGGMFQNRTMITYCLVMALLATGARATEELLGKARMPLVPLGLVRHRCCLGQPWTHQYTPIPPPPPHWEGAERVGPSSKYFWAKKYFFETSGGLCPCLILINNVLKQ